MGVFSNVCVYLQCNLSEHHFTMIFTLSSIDENAKNKCIESLANICLCHRRLVHDYSIAPFLVTRLSYEYFIGLDWRCIIGNQSEKIEKKHMRLAPFVDRMKVELIC